MATTTAIYNFQNIKQGDTFKAKTFRVDLSETEDYGDLTHVEMDFRKGSANSCDKELELKSGSGITILNPATRQFRIDRIEQFDLEPSYYVYSVRVTMVKDGVPTRRTYFEGGMTVIINATRD